MSKEYIEKEAAIHIKPNPVLGEWFDHGTDYITKYQALDIVAANNITTEMTLRCYDKIVDGIYKLPAVPREMTAREYLETEARMCKHYGLPCAFDVSGMTVDEAIEMVENFAREHPEERSEE
jgi:hypothetical protein